MEPAISLWEIYLAQTEREWSCLSCTQPISPSFSSHFLLPPVISFSTDSIALNYLLAIPFVSPNHSNTVHSAEAKRRWSGSVLHNLWPAAQRCQTKTSSQKATSVGENRGAAVGRDGLRGGVRGRFRNFSQHLPDFRINFGINNSQIQWDQKANYRILDEECIESIASCGTFIFFILLLSARTNKIRQACFLSGFFSWT